MVGFNFAECLPLKWQHALPEQEEVVYFYLSYSGFGFSNLINVKLNPYSERNRNL